MNKTDLKTKFLKQTKNTEISIKTLQININYQITPEEITQISQQIEKMKILQHLTILSKYNKINDLILTTLSQTLLSLPNLTHLKLFFPFSNIKTQGAQALAHSLK